MTQIPEADLNYKKIDRGEEGEVIYSKPHWFKKGKWVIKYKGNTYVFDRYDSCLLAELLIKITAYNYTKVK